MTRKTLSGDAHVRPCARGPAIRGLRSGVRGSVRGVRSYRQRRTAALARFRSRRRHRRALQLLEGQLVTMKHDGPIVVSAALMAVGWIFLIPPASARGQQVGERVRVTRAEGPALIGQVISLQEEGFHLYFGDRGVSLRVGYSDVLGVERSLGTRRHWGQGLAIGAGIGAILLSAAASSVDGDAGFAGGAVGGLFGGLAGAAVGGLMVQRERWETVEWDLGGGKTPGLLASIRPGPNRQPGLFLGGRIRS